jgi:hypothetical protein
MEKVIYSKHIKYLMLIGIYYLNNDSVYEGDFKDDKIEGVGKFKWSENKIYEGEWKDNCLHGFGVFIKTGKTYIGYFENDKKKGFGIFCYPNNLILLGKFIESIESATLVILLFKTLCYEIRIRY